MYFTPLQLIEACTAGDVKAVQRLLSLGVDVNVCVMLSYKFKYGWSITGLLCLFIHVNAHVNIIHVNQNLHVHYNGDTQSV